MFYCHHWYVVWPAGWDINPAKKNKKMTVQNTELPASCTSIAENSARTRHKPADWFMYTAKKNPFWIQLWSIYWSMTKYLKDFQV